MTTGADKEKNGLKRPNWEQITCKAEHGRNMRKASPESYQEWLRAVRRMHKGDTWAKWSHGVPIASVRLTTLAGLTATLVPY